MYLVYSVLCWALAPLSIMGILLICRNPRPPEWLKEVLSIILLPIMIGVLGMGVGLLARYAALAGDQPLAAKELGLIAIIIVIAALVVKILNIKKRLTAYQSLSAETAVQTDKVIGLAGRSPADIEAKQIAMGAGNDDHAPKAA